MCLAEGVLEMHAGACYSGLMLLQWATKRTLLPPRTQEPQKLSSTMGPTLQCYTASHPLTPSAYHTRPDHRNGLSKPWSWKAATLLLCNAREHLWHYKIMEEQRNLHVCQSLHVFRIRSTKNILEWEQDRLTKKRSSDFYGFR